MTVTGDRAGRMRRASGPLPDLAAAKLLPPLTRSGTVYRWSLIDGLAHGDPRPVVSVVASAGYGKTTLLSRPGGRPSP
jgi:ATP/maltotriose-dependent transcriptional regulator MalT